MRAGNGRRAAPRDGRCLDDVHADGRSAGAEAADDRVRGRRAAARLGQSDGYAEPLPPQPRGRVFTNNHSIVPTVTRGNATGIGSGGYPKSSGILGNSMYVPAVNPTAAFSTGDANQLTRLDSVTGGKMVFVETLGERLQAAGKSVLSLGSGTSGATLLLNPRAPRGVGQMVNTGDADGTVRLPAGARRADPGPLRRPAQHQRAAERQRARDLRRERAARSAAHAERPDVVLNWITEPDGSQHSFGVGAPQALSGSEQRQGTRPGHRQGARARPAHERVVASDHGFSLRDYNVNVDASLGQPPACVRPAPMT